jgi:hypothetical protein
VPLSDWSSNCRQCVIGRNCFHLLGIVDKGERLPGGLPGVLLLPVLAVEDHVDLGAPAGALIKHLHTKQKISP